MAETPLLQRLDGLDARFQEIGTLITDPQVIADQARYVKLTKEYKSLENLLKVTNRYKKLLADIDDAKAMLDEESDDDLRAMAKEEIDADSAQLPQLEQLRQKGYDVLFMTDEVDEFVPQSLMKYADKELRNITTEDLGLATEEEKKAAEEKTEQAKTTLDFVKDTLGDAVKADEIFTILMGENVEPRKEWIEANAKYVVNLDI